MFDASQAHSPVSSLSGGEKNRLLLAKTLAQPTNLLILDEPTNDLDMDTLDLLQDVLSDYSGTMLMVSHDRDFLDRLVTSTIVIEENAVLQEYPGGYSDYIRQKENRTDSPQMVKKVNQKTSVKIQNRKVVSKKKLSYKYQYALETLPKEMEEINAQIKKVEKKISEPSLYDKNPKMFNQATADLKNLVNNLADKEEQWLKLAMLSEGKE